MKEELLAQLMPFIEKTKEGILKAIEIVQRECPELIEQLLAWEFTVSIIPFSVGIIWFIVMLVFVRKFISAEAFDMYEGFNLLPPAIIFIVSGFLIFNNLVWLQILIAPKIYLLEYLSTLIK